MTRYYENSYIGREESVVNNPNTFLEVIKKKSKVALENLEVKLEGELLQWNDDSVYTGSMGIALLYFHLDSLQLGGHEFLEKAYQLLKRSVKHVKQKGISFLDGDTGTLTIGILIAHKSGDTKLRQDLLQRLVKIGDIALDTRDLKLANEYLYGRAGHLYSVLLLNSKIEGIIDVAFITKLARLLITQGQKGQHPFLYYEWHNKCYLGAVHGIAGIAYILLHTWQWLNEDERAWVKRTVDWLLTKRFPTGNLPSSLDSKDDRLIHFCHGAPGVIYTFILAHSILGDATYLDAAVACGEQIWMRGLLRKGYSICHGVAGNTYGLLALYHHTKDEKYLQRAYIFARWCFDYGKFCEHPPDRPLSLFEGEAGVVYMLTDLGFNQNPKFPGFEL